MPMWYLGSSYLEKIEKGYRGSVRSKKYKAIWLRELRENPQLFKTKIISIHSTDIEAREKELKLQKQLGVVKSPMYINESFATVNGYFGRITKGKDSHRFGVAHTLEACQKIKDKHHDVSGSNNPMFGRKGLENPKSKEFWAISPSGKTYKGKGVLQFCIEHNLTNPNVALVLKGIRPHHKGWKFGYV